MTSPRLIENWLPIKEISVEAIRERAGAVPNPAPHQLHVWWARRPLAPARAAIAAALLKANADRSEFYNLMGTYPGIQDDALAIAVAKETDSKVDGYANRRAFTHNPTPAEHAWFQDNLAIPNPVVLDVTAGGGSLPFEAGRLGLNTIANELNPVAALILKATCQWPQQYGNALLAEYQAVKTRFRERVENLMAGLYPAPEPRQDREIPREIFSRIVRHQRYVWAYLWCRTIDCPSCHREIPLSPNWRLDRKGTGIKILPDPAAGRCQFQVVTDAKDQSPGTVNKGVALCPSCGATAPKGYPAQQAQAGQMGHRLYAVIYRDSYWLRNKDGKESARPKTVRVFKPARPVDGDLTAIHSRLAQLQPQWDRDNILPNEPVPELNDPRPLHYGMSPWRYMFSPRQQLAHGYCVQAFRELVDADKESGELTELRQAAYCYVALGLDKMINRNSLLVRWTALTESVNSTFDSHDFGFKWSYAEMAITISGLGLDWGLESVDECIDAMIKMAGHPAPDAKAKDGAKSADRELLSPEIQAAGENPAIPSQVINGDAQMLDLEDDSVDAVIFDPPYYDNVNYAELSDFFYVWLKRTAGYALPASDLFTEHLTDKVNEAIASPARFKGQLAAGRPADLAAADYQGKMAAIFAEAHRVLKKDQGIMVVMFTHKSTAAWDAVTVALIEAGFQIVRTWPVQTEAESSLHIRDKAAARSTILLVCRPRQPNPRPLPWHQVEQLIAQAVQEDLRDNLEPAGLRPIDLYLSAFGPALRVISEQWGTERETANPDRPLYPFVVTPTDALQVARREVSQRRAQALSRDWAARPGDAAARFYILAKDAAANDTLLFDEANLLSRVLGVNLSKTDPAMKGIVKFSGDKVTLLSARERLAAGSIGEDQNPGSLLDTVHTALALTDRRNTLDAQQWLTQRRQDPQEAPFRATLEALLRTTRPGHDDYQAQRNLWQALYSVEPPPPADRQEPLL